MKGYMQKAYLFQRKTGFTLDILSFFSFCINRWIRMEFKNNNQRSYI
jgi:hypothetical protein